MFDFNDEYVQRMLTEYGVLKRLPHLPGIAWFELPPDGGYLVMYESGDHNHTYHNPENW